MTLCTMCPRSRLELFQSLLSTTIFCSSCCRPDFLSCLLTVLTTATHASMLLQALFRLSSTPQDQNTRFSPFPPRRALSSNLRCRASGWFEPTPPIGHMLPANNLKIVYLTSELRLDSVSPTLGSQHIRNTFTML